MQVVRQNLWDVDCAFRGITTNGQVKPASKKAIMGAGIARDALERYPGLDDILGALLTLGGNHLWILSWIDGLFSFPTKHKWYQNSDLELIQQSVCELDFIARNNPQAIYAMPLPGVGNGNLSPRLVWPLLWTLPDNVIITLYNTKYW